MRVPDALAPCEPLTVLRHQIDTNEHVNNGQYMQIALEVLPSDIVPACVRVDYRRSAVLGDTIYPRFAQEDGRTVVVLDAPDGKPYAVVEFS